MIDITSNMTIITPIAEGECSHLTLLERLYSIGFNGEVLLVLSRSDVLSSRINPILSDKFNENLNLKVLLQSGSRAQKLNAASHFARGDILWFLHADTIIDADSVRRLVASYQTYQDRLHYFNLGFFPKNYRLMHINALGVKFRSNFLGIPFGDQGFCLSKDLFFKVCGYPIDCPYGEDHVFVWRVRLSGHRLNLVRKTIWTSARKYQSHGWLKTTLVHLGKTFLQATPFALQLMSRKIQGLLCKKSSG